MAIILTGAEEYEWRKLKMSPAEFTAWATEENAKIQAQKAAAQKAEADLAEVNK